MPAHCAPVARAGRRLGAALLASVAVAVLLSGGAQASPGPGPPGPPSSAGPASSSGPASASPAELARQIEAASGQLDIVVEQYNSMRERLATLRTQRTAVARQLVPLRRAMDRLQDSVGRIAADLYMHAGRLNWVTLLGVGGPGSDLLDQLAMVEHLARQEHQQVNALRAAQGRYTARQHTLDFLVTRQSAQQAALAARRISIESRIATLKQLRIRRYGGGWLTPARPDRYIPPYLAGRAGLAVRYAFEQIGKAYRWAAAGPLFYDCSGLTMASWDTAGVSLPHNAAMQWHSVTHIPRSQLRPGDLVFYFSDIHHVAIYIGDDKVIHAPTYGMDVTIAPLDLAPVHGYGRP